MATWYDTGNPASANGTEDQSDGGIWWNDNSGTLSLPAGTVDSLRVYANSDTFGQGVKIALYDSSHNIVTGASGTNSSEGTGTGWKTVTFSPVSITAGTYYAAATTNNSNAEFVYATLTGQASGTSFAHFGASYAAFPPSSQGSQDVNRTTLMYFGVQVTGSSAAPLTRLPLLGVG